MRFRYRALGLDIAAPFACPGLWPSDGSPTGRDITLEQGPVPPHLPDPVRDRPFLQIEADGTALHRVPGVARYLMRERTRVTIALEPGASLGRAIDFLKGTPLALLCRQWGLVPLDALCLAWEGRALLLGAAAGCGKSTLALALADHGFRLMGDGICALDAPAGAAPSIWPAFPEVKVWRDSLEALDHPVPWGEPGPGGRYTLPAVPWFDPAPRPVLALALLHPARGGVTEQATRRRGASAFQLAMNLQSLADAMRGLPPVAAPMRAVGRLADRIPVHDVWYPSGLDRVAALPGWLIGRLALAGPALDRESPAACV